MRMEEQGQDGRVELPPQPDVEKLDLVGTAEVAEMLGVERPRIARWRARGQMPDTVVDLAATPVWRREHIEAMIPWVEANRRHRTRSGWMRMGRGASHYFADARAGSSSLCGRVDLAGDFNGQHQLADQSDGKVCVVCAKQLSES
jgi:hypothetical protein